MLVVGGSGMLRGMTAELVQRAGTVTSISRTRTVPGATNVALDYRDSAALRTAVDSSVADAGPIELVVAWIHDTAPDEPLLIAETVASAARPVRFFHVLGSAAADPASAPDRLALPFAQLDGLTYHQIVLGFQIESGRSRWLTHSEISEGVLFALERPQPVAYVGQVRPWSSRP